MKKRSRCKASPKQYKLEITRPEQTKLLLAETGEEVEVEIDGVGQGVHEALVGQ